jgi:hypothetical protein
MIDLLCFFLFVSRHVFYRIDEKMMNESNTSLLHSVSNNHFLRDCIELAIDGFLFRGVTPSDHYYRFSQSFPKAFFLLNGSNVSIQTTPKQGHRQHSSKSSANRSFNVPLLDLSSLPNQTLLEQPPVSTIMSTNTTGLMIKTKKPVYSPKDVGHLFSFRTSINFAFLVDFIFIDD